MKKIFLALIAVVFFFFAGSSAKAEEIKTFVGTIQSFPHGPGQFKSGPPLWPFGMIVVAADNGEKNNFLIVGPGPNATTFYDADGKATTVTHVKVEIGKKVEVNYTITEQTRNYLNKMLAISVRYVPADYVPQPTVPGKPATVSETTTNTSGINIFVGKIEKDGPAFRYFWKFTAVADNGEKKEFCVPRGDSTIIQIDGKQRYGEAPRKGKKIEVKYSVTEGGDNKTVSMRYVPLDYVQQPIASSVPANAPSETTQPIQEKAGQTGNAFTGKIESFRPVMGRPPKWLCARFTAVADNGEKKEIWIFGASGGSPTSVTDFDGKPVDKPGYNHRPQVGKKVEVKYLTAENGRYEAVSIRYLN